MQTIDTSFLLPDGRRLGYRILGDPSGKPFFLFHGTPGSRFVLVEEDDLARIPGIKIILPERPGYGISDPQPDRTLLDWPKDVAALADHLGFDRFAVGGGSGGGPHALACAHQLADRVSITLLLSSPAPANIPGATKGMAMGNRIGLLLGRYAPWVYGFLVGSYQKKFKEDPDGVLDGMAAQMGKSDQELLRDPHFRATILLDMTEAYRQGVQAHLLDGSLGMTSRGWGFDLREIKVPVRLWWGEEDTLVTRAMTEHLAAVIPDAHLHVIAGAGHLLTESPIVVQEVRAALGL